MSVVFYALRFVYVLWDAVVNFNVVQLSSSPFGIRVQSLPPLFPFHCPLSSAKSFSWMITPALPIYHFKLSSRMHPNLPFRVYPLPLLAPLFSAVSHRFSELKDHISNRAWLYMGVCMWIVGEYISTLKAV